MAIKKSEKKKLKLDAKKIGRILCFALLTVALLVGIIFSSVKVNMNMIYGPEYNGAFQASVQVIDPNKDKDNISLDELAQSLSDKLAPFSDKSINVTKNGQRHLTVTAGKKDYQSNETYFRNQIQSNGGLFMLKQTTNGYEDFYISAKDAQNGSKRYNSQDFFTGNVKTASLSNGSGRDSFVRLGLKPAKAGDNDPTKTLLAQVLNDETKADNKTKAIQLDGVQASHLVFATDLEQMVDTLRYFYIVKDNDDAKSIYFNDIIKPMRAMYSSATDKQKVVYKNLFAGTVKWTNGSGTIEQTSKISLIDDNSMSPNFKEYMNNTLRISSLDSEEALDKILDIFTPNTSEMPTSNFLYSPDADMKAVNKNFKDWFSSADSGDSGVTLQESFSTTINAFLQTDASKRILLASDKVDGVTPKINSNLTKYAPQLANNILFDGAVVPSTSGDGVTNSISGEVSKDTSFIVDNKQQLKQDSTGIQNGFYLRTNNLTSAKKAVASIKQNALGVSYLVESIVSVNPYITSVMYILSVVFLSLIALLLAIYVLFVYRLLGLFTLIIAACSIAIVLLAAVGFGIGMGPQVIAALFLITALILDTNFILFEGWKDNYYDKKHGIISSFKIGNKETLAMSVDAVLVAFIPNIVLFWAATGPLKTFGTLSIIGVGMAVIAGIIIGRFIYWLILKAKFVQKTEWLLPMDTRYSQLATIRDEFAINKYSKYLENHEGKTNYTTKELEKISKAKQGLEEAKKSYNKNLLANNAKVAARDEKTIKWVNKNNNFWIKTRTWVIKAFKIKHPDKNFLVKIIDGRIDDNQVVLDVDKEEQSSDTPNKSKLRNKGKIVRADRTVSRGMFFLICAMLVIGFIAAIVGGVSGIHWANGVGYGQQFVIYGARINDIEANIGTSKFQLEDEHINNKWNAIKNEYETKISPTNDENTNRQYYAYEIRDFFAYLDKNDLFGKIGNKTYTKKINLAKTHYSVITNYDFKLADGSTSKDQVALVINSSSTDVHSRSEFKRLWVDIIDGYWPGHSQMDPSIPESTISRLNNDEGGLQAYDNAPFTVSKEIRNVAIAFGIALAVLVAYILIRFKWTYYVALALGLGLVIGTVVALIVIFRVPVSLDLLAGMAFVITFALTSMILVLGKGKSKLNLENKDNLKEKFSESIKLSAELRAKKAETQKGYVPMRKELNKEWWQIFRLKLQRLVRRNGFTRYEELEELIAKHGQLKNDYKAAKKEQTGIYKSFKEKTKHKQDELQRKNWYFKELFSTLIKYSTWRMATLGVFYLLVSIILAATLPSVVGLGLTIMFGLIAGFSIALFFTVPVWVYFEKRRIRYHYGRKVYIESLKVSNEEEIVKGIND